MELPQKEFFMQLMQLSAYKVLILSFGHIFRQVLVQKFRQIQEENDPSGITILNQLQNFPRAEGGSAAVS